MSVPCFEAISSENWSVGTAAFRFLITIFSLTLDEWTINYLMELPSTMTMGYLSLVSSAVEEVTGKRAISFS
jgi:hypothetical protein